MATINAGLLGAGEHYFALYVDHDIDEAINTFFNEYGTPVDTAIAQQSWEIDEPGFVYGDIYDNFLAGSLDNSNGVPAAAPDDVSMALAWRFTLSAGETATIQMLLSETAPGGFYLAHTDPDSTASVYFSSTLGIASPLPGVPDGGATLTLLTLTLAGLGGLRRK